MNATQPPLSDKRVRQAMHYALDVAAIIKNLYAGMGKPFSGGVADTDFGYNAALKPYPYDPGKAKILLTQAGYGGGVDLTVHAGTGTLVNDSGPTETIGHEEKPWLELFQEVVVYGTSRRVAFRPRADYRLIVSEMQVSR